MKEYGDGILTRLGWNEAHSAGKACAGNITKGCNIANTCNITQDLDFIMLHCRGYILQQLYYGI